MITTKAILIAYILLTAPASGIRKRSNRKIPDYAESESSGNYNMKIKIKTKKEGRFHGDDGDVEYYWYTGYKEDGFLIRFGSTDGGHKEGSTVDIDIESRPTSNGKMGYFEVL